MRLYTKDQQAVIDLLKNYTLPIDEYGHIDGEAPAIIKGKILALTSGQRLLTQEEILELMLLMQEHEYTGSSYLEVYDKLQEYRNCAQTMCELLSESRKGLAEHMCVEDGMVCYLCGDITSEDCHKSHNFKLAQAIDVILNKCPDCLNKVQTTQLTPPDTGIAVGCTKCSYSNFIDIKSYENLKEENKQLKLELEKIAEQLKELNKKADAANGHFGWYKA